MTARATGQSTPKQKTIRSPLKFFDLGFCNHCPDQQYCNANLQRKHLCILTLVANELATLRQLLQRHAPHLVTKDGV